MSDQSGPKLNEWIMGSTHGQADRVAELQECAHKEQACQLARSILQRAQLWGNELYEGNAFVYRASRILEQKIGSAAMCGTFKCAEHCTLSESLKNQTTNQP